MPMEKIARVEACTSDDNREAAMQNGFFCAVGELLPDLTLL